MPPIQNNDETWDAQRVNINNTLDRFEKTLTILENRSSKIMIDIAVIKVKMGMIAIGVAFVVSAASNILMHLLSNV